MKISGQDPYSEGQPAVYPAVVPRSSRSPPRVSRGDLVLLQVAHSLLLGSTRAATSSNFQPYDLYLKIVCRADLALQSLEGGTNELLNLPAIKARKMEMLFLSPDLVVVLFTVEVHQVQFIDHPEALQQLDGSVRRSSIDIRISNARQLQQAFRVQMTRRLLNGLNQCAALCGQTYPPGFHLTQ